MQRRQSARGDSGVRLPAGVAGSGSAALVLIFGTLICLVPSKVKLQYARTEVVGYHQENMRRLQK